MKQIWTFLRKVIGNRILWTLIIVIAIFTGLIRNLYIMQILNEEEYAERMYEDTVEEFSLGGARGNIYDCYGRPLAINTTSKSLYYKTDSDNPSLNDSLLKLLDTLEANHEELAIKNQLPIRYDQYTGFYFTDRLANPTGTARLNFLAEIFGTKRSDLTEEQAASTAEDAYYRMRDITFSIDPSLPMETVLVLMNIRYVFFQNRWNPEEPVLVAENISEKTQAIVLEQSDRYVGFYVETEYTRTYPQGKYFAHIIGYTGRISEEELERNKDKGYTETDMIGKAGLEAAYEEDLRSVKGTVAVTYSGRTGERLKEETVVSPAKGNDLILTIDADFQKECYDLLYANVKKLLLDKITGYHQDDNESYSAMDVIVALVNNGFFDLYTIQDSKNSEAIRYMTVYNKEAERVITELEHYLLDSDTILAYYPEDMLEYLTFIVAYMRDQGYLDYAYHDDSSDVYVRYIGGVASAREFLDYCYNSGYFSLEEFGLDGFTPAEKGLPVIVHSILEAIRHNRSYEQLVCTNVLTKDLFSVHDFILLCYDLKFLNNDDGSRERYADGDIGNLGLLLMKIQNDEITPADINLDPCSGSLVVTDCDSGKVRAIVSYPSYDTNLYLNSPSYYNRILADQSAPMMFRALQERRAPGSTYKLCTAATALELGYITTNYYVYDDYEYPNVNSVAKPVCWSKSSHGTINVIDAIKVSCNYFFYDVGYHLCDPLPDKTFNDQFGLEKMNHYAVELGLATETGIELPESTPHLSAEDAVRSAIGQGGNAFTVANINRYTNTVANGGDVYDLYLVDQVKSADGQILFKKDPQPVSHAAVSKENFDIIRQGMRLVNTQSSGDVLGILDQLGVTTAGKTGSAEESAAHPDHSWYTGYTNIEDPEISITILIPFGNGSTMAVPIFKEVVEAYYDLVEPQAAASGGEDAEDTEE